jgi:beta-glucosidase-like glycosyl hydrolase
MAKVDEIVGRVLTEKFRLGLFENPMPMKTPSICKITPPGRLRGR